MSQHSDIFSTTCKKCGELLKGKPKINVEGNIYCFRCAKEQIKAREEIRECAIMSHRATIQWKNEEWSMKLDRYTKLGKPGRFVGVIFAIISYSIAEVYTRIGGGLGIIIAFLIWISIWSIIKENRKAKFISQNPKPIIDDIPDIPEIDYYLMEPDRKYSINSRYRENILERDEFKCQLCGKRKRAQSDLEVHHVEPKAFGGTDDPTNLITLCKHCHDREDLFDHCRVYPTTLQKPRNQFW